MRFKIISAFVFFAISACVERIEAPVIRTGETLVVDGALTSAVGQAVVKLFYATALDDRLTEATPATDALVEVIENGSSVHAFVEVEPGTYEGPASFQGAIGNTYQLHIETKNGKRYESTPSVMKDAGSIDKIYAEFRENSINRYDLTKPQDAFFLYVDATGAEPARNLLRWRWNATYQVHTAPEKRVIYTGTGPVPDPPACANPCTCCDCWVTFSSNNVAISNPTTTSGPSNKGMFVGMIPVSNIYFYDKLLIRLEQLSLSEEVFGFWSLVRAQHAGADDIFQPDVVHAQGNISCVTHPREQVFGIFSVADIAEGQLELRLQDVPKRIPSYEVINDDCRYTGGTNVRPWFY